MTERGTAPAFIRCDNGPEPTADALRVWCRFSRAGSAYIEPGSPWQNPYVESFGDRIRDELLAVELFSCLPEAQVLVEDWRQDYNQNRPHSALRMMTPTAFSLGYRTAHRAASEHLSPLGGSEQSMAGWNNNNQQPTALTAGGPMNGGRSRGLVEPGAGIVIECQEEACWMWSVGRTSSGALRSWCVDQGVGASDWFGANTIRVALLSEVPPAFRVPERLSKLEPFRG